MSIRAVGRSENTGVSSSFGGHNLPPLVERGLIDLVKSGSAMAGPPSPPGTTGLNIIHQNVRQRTFDMASISARQRNPLASIVWQKRAKNPSQESKTRGIDFGRRQTRLKAAMFPDFFRAARSAVAG